MIGCQNYEMFKIQVHMEKKLLDRLHIIYC